MSIPLLFLLERTELDVQEDLSLYTHIMLKEMRLLIPNQSQYQENIIYVTKYLEYNPCWNPNCNWMILQLSSKSKNIPGVLTLSNSYDFLEISNRILNILSEFNALEIKMKYSIQKQNSLQNIIPLISKVMGNPCYITDFSFKVLAIDQSPVLSEISSIWRNISNHGYLSYDIVYNLRKNGDLEKMESCNQPLLFYSNCFHNPFISCCLKHDNHIYGYLFIVGYQKKITPGEVLFSSIIKDIVTKKILESFSPSDKLRKDYEYFFIHSINGEFHDMNQIVCELKSLQWNIAGAYCVVRLETSLKDEALYQRLCENLYAMGECRAFLYQDGVVAIFAMQSSSYTELVSRLHKLASNRKCICTISDKFFGFQNIHTFYKQTKIIIKYLKNQMKEKNSHYGAVTYTNCAANQLIQCCTQEQRDVFYWKNLDFLKSYDERHKTEYMKTLACYLNHERNITLTAQTLYIHRNTLIYRITRLSQLLDCNFDDPAVRLRLLFSLQMME